MINLDNKFKISESIIKKLKEHKVKTPTPYHPD
ncbi:Putative membrane protein (fragment) [Xenorhabdus nematophila ATCC 19061]|uniref:Membrane protein n=1 Tax=Xenorhabdus nematophila (strain ATCC 19061 / DSM 3370 / CCUG 14189 / LMG 1036 / NCIMB 9965 / AN6) TaxID=406817 RepID=D3VJJ0_XENNA